MEATEVYTTTRGARRIRACYRGRPFGPTRGVQAYTIRGLLLSRCGGLLLVFGIHKREGQTYLGRALRALRRTLLMGTDDLGRLT